MVCCVYSSFRSSAFVSRVSVNISVPAYERRPVVSLALRTDVLHTRKALHSRWRAPRCHVTCSLWRMCVRAVCDVCVGGRSVPRTFVLPLGVGAQTRKPFNCSNVRWLSPTWLLSCFSVVRCCLFFFSSAFTTVSFLSPILLPPIIIITCRLRCILKCQDLQEFLFTKTEQFLLFSETFSFRNTVP